MHFSLFAGDTVVGTVFVWLAAVAFLAGGIANATGHAKIRANFVRYGFPFWWCWVTAALEIVTAVLLVGADTRPIGVALGACIMLAALAAMLRVRHYGELAPPLAFLLLLALAGFSGQA